ncbi:hypothetical protein D9M72_438210 [compost metagenome]
MELQAGVAGFPAGLGRQVLGHVGLGAHRLVLVEQFAGLPAHQVGGFQLDERLGDRELHALVLADGAAEDFALADVLGDAVHEPVAVADALGGDQGALGVEAVEDVLETLAFFADQVFLGDFQVFEEQLVGLVVDHVRDRPHGQALLLRFMQVHHEDGHAFALLLHVGKRRGARQQDHEVAVLHAADPHLLAVDDIAAVLLDRRGLDLGGVGAGGGLGHAHRLQAPFARGDLGQVLFLLRLGTVAQQRAHVVHLAVAGTGIAAAAVDFFHDDRGFGQAQAGAAVFLRDQRRQPAGRGQCVDEGLGVGALLVDLAEVLVREFGAKRAHGIADFLVVVRLGLFDHGASLAGFYGRNCGASVSRDGTWGDRCCLGRNSRCDRRPGQSAIAKARLPRRLRPASRARRVPFSRTPKPAIGIVK